MRQHQPAAPRPWPARPLWLDGHLADAKSSLASPPQARVLLDDGSKTGRSSGGASVDAELACTAGATRRRRRRLVDRPAPRSHIGAPGLAAEHLDRRAAIRCSTAKRRALISMTRPPSTSTQKCQRRRRASAAARAASSSKRLSIEDRATPPTGPASAPGSSSTESSSIAEKLAHVAVPRRKSSMVESSSCWWVQPVSGAASRSRRWSPDICGAPLRPAAAPANRSAKRQLEQHLREPAAPVGPALTPDEERERHRLGAGHVVDAAQLLSPARRRSESAASSSCSEIDSSGSKPIVIGHAARARKSPACLTTVGPSV